MRTGEVRITNKQRSWTNALLFKNFGETNVAYFILNHCIPAILDVPLRKKALTKAMFKNMLEELMIWHASPLQSLLDRQKNPDMKHVRRRSALNEQKRHRQRREEKKKAKQRIDKGVRLSKQRYSCKRKCEEISAIKQQIWEDYDTRKTHKDHAKEFGKRLPQVRGNMIPRWRHSQCHCCRAWLLSPNPTATEHGCSLPKHYDVAVCVRTPLLQSMAAVF